MSDATREEGDSAAWRAWPIVAKKTSAGLERRHGREERKEASMNRRIFLRISWNLLYLFSEITYLGKAMNIVLASAAELAAELGKSLRLARAASGLRQEDLARASGASLQAIKNLEGGGKVELITFLKVAQSLGMGAALWESCQPAPQTLDEIERVEAARSESSRVRRRQ